MNLTKEEVSLNGFVIVDKPLGMTSHDVVHKIRKICNTKKVGHAGTLDPEASGVLVVGLGKATRLLTYVVSDNKTYQATIRLGQNTTTDDAQGEMTSEQDCHKITDEEISNCLLSFIGDIDQIPSSVSAIKVGGKKAYEIVRSGEKVELTPRRIHISAIDLHEIKRIGNLIDISVTVHCSSGTYIRALARDIGQKLKVGGHVTSLRRIQSGRYKITDSVNLENLDIDKIKLISMADVAMELFPSVKVELDEIQDLIHGRFIRKTHEPAQTIALVDKKPSLVALAQGDGVMLKPQVVFASGIGGV
ncbi:MAG: hypothetical protein RLZZ37_1078 [Actinomycetota bacterium]|jgi:tRNA pseudouridine55 synthase